MPAKSRPLWISVLLSPQSRCFRNFKFLAVVMRSSKGQDIQGACGQLVTRERVEVPGPVYTQVPVK